MLGLGASPIYSNVTARRFNSRESAGMARCTRSLVRLTGSQMISAVKARGEAASGRIWAGNGTRTSESRPETDSTENPPV